MSHSRSASGNWYFNRHFILSPRLDLAPWLVRCLGSRYTERNYHILGKLDIRQILERIDSYVWLKNNISQLGLAIHHHYKIQHTILRVVVIWILLSSNPNTSIFIVPTNVCSNLTNRIGKFYQYNLLVCTKSPQSNCWIITPFLGRKFPSKYLLPKHFFPCTLSTVIIDLGPIRVPW